MSSHIGYRNIAKMIKGWGGGGGDFEIKDQGRREFIIAIALICLLSFFFLEGLVFHFGSRLAVQLKTPNPPYNQPAQTATSVLLPQDSNPNITPFVIF